jgi:hypothetical protein
MLGEQRLHLKHPAPLQVSPRKLAHTRPVHETWNMRYNYNCLNPVSVTSVASLRTWNTDTCCRCTEIRELRVNMLTI